MLAIMEDSQSRHTFSLGLQINVHRWSVWSFWPTNTKSLTHNLIDNNREPIEEKFQSRSGEREFIAIMIEGTSSLFTHNVPNSFTITLVSSASKKVFKDNTMAIFKCLLSEEISLQCEWRVAVTQSTFPTQINNVTDSNFVYYKKIGL